MTRLFIAEKPSLGRAIAAALPRPHKQENGAIVCGNGDVVTWCIGHLLEQVEPDAYDEKYKKWNLSDLPIIPSKWQLKPRKSASKQLSVIKKLVKTATCIVHAGDPDREGQLLVDEVIEYCKVSKTKKEAMQRLLISDLNLPAVKRALQSMRQNQEFIPLSVSALARSRADWLYGMNMSRAYTLLGKKAGYQGVLSVGRVQTPVLGLVARRDEEIENFVAKDYFQLDALIPYQSNDQSKFDIRARWKPSEACAPWQDENKRVLSHKLVVNVAERIKGQVATVTDAEQKQTKQNAPLLYSLSALQIDAAKRFGLSAQQVLDTCQSLYEKHKLITYPRSDCRYLPKEHLSQSGQIMSAIASNSNELQSAVNQADLSLKSKVWNDSKVSAHHAIIPTPKTAAMQSLSSNEQKVYQQIARQYIMQFYPAAVYAEARLVFDIAGGEFVAKGRQLIFVGWKVLLGNNKEESNIDTVPALTKGSQLTCREGHILSKKTEPPKFFTEATLLQAMTGISRFVVDKALKSILKETDGLGTEATRAGILDTLFKRQLLMREGKTIKASQAGRGLVHALPMDATFPDMTAHWEHQLQAMAEKGQAYAPFMDALEDKVLGLMTIVKTAPLPVSLRDLPAIKRPKFKRKYKKAPKKS